MLYKNIIQAVFIKRLNRFVAEIRIGSELSLCHVKNTGRCEELLRTDAVIYVEKNETATRKTPYTLIAVEKNGILFNIDSYAPNIAAKEWIANGGLGFIPNILKSETVYGNSRFDLYYEYGMRKGFIEVKGVTLERNGIAYFPDAPTLRGVKHIEELRNAKTYGYDAMILFIAQFSPVTAFSPNRETHPAFADALIEAEKAQVEILCMDTAVTPDSMVIGNKIPVIL